MAISERQARQAIDYIRELREVRDKFQRSATTEHSAIILGTFEIGDVNIYQSSGMFAEAKNLFQRALLDRVGFIAAWLRNNGFEVPE